jgi:flagellar protein FliO/FliZ
MPSMNATSGLLPLLWFLAILALIPVALWLLKRTPMGGASVGGLLRIVSALPVAPNQRLLIVEVGQGEARQWLVLGATATGISTLHTMAPQAEPPATAGFAQLLGKRLKEGSGDAA